MQLMDGTVVAAHIKEWIKRETAALVSETGRAPHLAAILVGADAASQVYVGSKVKTCEELGFGSTLLRFDAGISESELLDVIARLNTDDTINGILVQLPLPKHISETAVINAISPAKDVGGFTPVSQGKMVLGQTDFSTGHSLRNLAHAGAL